MRSVELWCKVVEAKTQKLADQTVLRNVAEEASAACEVGRGRDDGGVPSGGDDPPGGSAMSLLRGLAAVGISLAERHFAFALRREGRGESRSASAQRSHTCGVTLIAPTSSFCKGREAFLAMSRSCAPFFRRTRRTLPSGVAVFQVGMSFWSGGCHPHRRPTPPRQSVRVGRRRGALGSLFDSSSDSAPAHCAALASSRDRHDNHCGDCNLSTRRRAGWWSAAARSLRTGGSSIASSTRHLRTIGEVVQDGHRRRQNRSGSVAQVARIDTYVGDQLAHDFVAHALAAQAHFESFPLDPHNLSGHVPLCVSSFRRLSSAGGHRLVPRWAPKYPQFPAVVERHLDAGIGAEDMVSREVEHCTRAPGADMLTIWQAHQLANAGQLWMEAGRQGGDHEGPSENAFAPNFTCGCRRRARLGDQRACIVALSLMLWVTLEQLDLELLRTSGSPKGVGLPEACDWLVVRPHIPA